MFLEMNVKNKKKMINWKELEKFVAPGKVMTLVIMIDGVELGALSFSVDSLAYKDVLEKVSAVEGIKIADKASDKVVDVKSNPAKKKTDSPPLSKTNPKLAEEVKKDTDPMPMDEGGDGIEVDTDTGEIKPEEKKPLTRDQIMAGTITEQVKTVEVNDLSESAVLITAKKETVDTTVSQPTISENW